MLPVPPSLATIMPDVDDISSIISKIEKLRQKSYGLFFLNRETCTILLSSTDTHLSLSLGGRRCGHCLTMIYQKQIYRVYQTFFFPILGWIFNPTPLRLNEIRREEKVHFLSVCFSTQSYCCGNRKGFYYTVVPEGIHSQGTLP